LPYSDYVDEGHVLHQTIDAFNNGSLDVYWYGLPALPAYSAGAMLLLYSPFYSHFHGHDFRKDLPHERALPSSKVNYDLIAPVELIVAGRLATACLSLATVVLAGIIAAQLATPQAGIFAMLLVSVCPALVTRGSIVIADTFAAFFVLLVLYSCTRIRSVIGKQVWLYVGLAGVGAGLAFASKYPAATVGVAVLATILSLPVRWRRRLQLFLPAAGGFALGVALGAPMTFIKPVTVWSDVVANIRAYAEIHSTEGYFAQATSMSELGFPLLVVGLAGIILMLKQEKTRTTALAWVCFALLLVASFWGKSFRPFRSFLPLIPPLCIAAAFTFSWLMDWARRQPHPWAGVALAAALAFGLPASLCFSSFRLERERIAHKDSRVQAIAWLLKNAGKDKTILGIRELFILPSEWDRIANTTVVSWFEAAHFLEKHRFDYIVTGDFDLRNASDPKAWAGYRDAWQAKVSPLPVQADFGQIVTPIVPYLWRTNDERILILKQNTP
jgi:Dolichyl-phosphate-mannose-protein mannosyltransferase